MIVTLTGENSFSLQAELTKRTNDFLAVHGDLALERIDGADVSLDRLSEALTSLPFLASAKLVVLRSPSTNKQFVEQFEQLLSDIPETTDVILVEPKLDKRLSYYKWLTKNTDFHEFSQLDAGGVSSWLSNEATKRGGKLSISDARLLVERVGIDQQFLSNELDKLLLYEAAITRTSIELLTDAAPQSSIFELLEAAFAGQAKRVVQIYADQRAQKVEAPQIIAMLAWQLHVLAVIKVAGERSADEIAKDARLNPFVVRKSQNVARRLSLTELKKLVNDLLKIDTASKRTNLDADEALQHYLLTISS
jgi:DNA polymerase-3 subunit delta